MEFPDFWGNMGAMPLCLLYRNVTKTLGVVGLPMDRYVPPENFWRTRVLAVNFTGNLSKMRSRTRFYRRKFGDICLQTRFTLFESIFIPAFRGFFLQKPVCTVGTYLRDFKFWFDFFILSRFEASWRRNFVGDLKTSLERRSLAPRLFASLARF